MSGWRKDITWLSHGFSRAPHPTGKVPLCPAARVAAALTWEVGIEAMRLHSCNGSVEPCLGIGRARGRCRQVVHGWEHRSSLEAEPECYILDLNSSALRKATAGWEADVAHPTAQLAHWDGSCVTASFTSELLAALACFRRTRPCQNSQALPRGDTWPKGTRSSELPFPSLSLPISCGQLYAGPLK